MRAIDRVQRSLSRTLHGLKKTYRNCTTQPRMQLVPQDCRFRRVDVWRIAMDDSAATTLGSGRGVGSRGLEPSMSPQTKRSSRVHWSSFTKASWTAAPARSGPSVGK